MPNQARVPKAEDVAQLAGVSAATVSRAFNSPDRVEAVTLARVRDAASKLGYLPNGVARSLRRHRSMVVGALIPTLASTYFARTIQQCESILAGRGYATLLATSNYDPAQELRAVRAMIAQGIDALLLVGRPQGPEVLALLRSQSIPYLVCWVAQRGVPSVGFDHRHAMFTLTRHLVSLGHRHVAAVIPFRATNDLIRDRVQGIEEALAMDGIELEPAALIDDLGLDLPDGRLAWKRLREHAPRTTAVVCGNDNLAAGVILECHAMGLNVPSDVSVTGYNDLPIAAAFIPSITTMSTPVDAVAQAATHALLARMAGGDEPGTRVFSTDLIVRESTAAFAPRSQHKGRP